MTQLTETKKQGRIKVKALKVKGEALLGSQVCIKGWVRTVREQKTFSFVEVNDGSCVSNMQVIIDFAPPAGLSTGAAVIVEGVVVASPGAKQAIEIKASSIQVCGTCDPETYVLQKKRHSLEFLRSIAHLRPRTNVIGAVSRVRNALAFATHKFFQEEGFLYVHTPVITASDCEGAGEMLQVTTLSLDKPPRTEDKGIDYSKDFFGKPAFLTVSGQLNGEAYATALSDIYTFGPTFRAENSHTSRHLAEFWMIEPEMAFADIEDNMDCAERYIRYTLQYVLDTCLEDLELFDSFIAKGLIERLRHVAASNFARVTYTEAVDILLKCGKKFEYPVKWGCDLQSEHERYLAEEHFKKPVICRNYPKEIKSFYMRLNEDGKTVAAMDILVPGIGELVGGSQREERIDVLEAKMDAAGLDKNAYWWYLDLRRYGSVPHSGFGLGFERLVQYATGMENIRDVIPFPRFAGSADF